MNNLHADNPIILFDGLCKFCNAGINYIIRKDKKKKFRFLLLQNASSKEITKNFENKINQSNSIILINGQQAYIRSTAVIRIAIEIGGIYRTAFLFYAIPTFIRDIIYNMVARNRYRIFGKYNSCMVPDATVRERFLD